jgi:putative membrane protein
MAATSPSSRVAAVDPAPLARYLGAGRPPLDLAVPVGIVLAGVVIAWLCHTFPAAMPFWMPWEFSWLAWLGTALPIWWYLRGTQLMPAAERPHPARRVAFLLGMLFIYAVLQTRYLYLAEHLFFLNRIQHVVMHHLGPFLVALGVAGAPLRRAMPRALVRLIDARPVGRLMAVLQQPLVAATLFVGLVAFWLVPPIHFRAMIDQNLFWVMNWSMVLDGLLFWCLVLDPRPRPPARLGYGLRAALSAGVIFPQILIGALIVFAGQDLYPYYTFCGRLYPSIGPMYDQFIGGFVVWIPPAMMGVVGLILVLNHLRLNDEATEASAADPEAARMTALAARWTGR